MKPDPLVAIVILTYNGRHYLQQFLPAVLASTYINIKVIIGDNASTDDTVTWMANHYPQIDVLQNPENFGYAKGYNQILQQVKADYFVLLNSDVEVTPGWIEPIINLMETGPLIAASQPKLLAYNNKTEFEYAGASGGWMDALGYPFTRGRVFDYCEKDHGQYNDTSKVFWASGAALFVRANLFAELNGFDEYFFAHQEEIDLCWRLQKAGYSIMVCPASVVYHVGGGTLPKGHQKVFLNFRNNLVMLAKNWRFSEKLWKMPLRILLDAVAAWRALLGGDKNFFKAVLQAHVAFLGWVLKHKTNRRSSHEPYTVLHGVFKGSVIIAHFIKKKKTFAEIVTQTQ